MKPLSILSVLLLVASLHSSAQTSKWTPLFTPDLKNFDIFIGVPHTSLTTLPGVPKGDGMKGIPLGLNNDPLHVFTTEMVDGKPVLHISGEIYGGLSTKEEFGNYHLRIEFKWGTKQYQPKPTGARDGGIVYHAHDPQGQFWTAWMSGHNFQAEEKNLGHYYAFTSVGADIHARKIDTSKRSKWIYDPAAPLTHFAAMGTPTNSCTNGGDYEKPSGEWNTFDLYCYGDKSIHVVNGHVVMVLENSRTVARTGQPGAYVITETPLVKGKIQLQSEGGEAYYRNMEIVKIDKLPELK